MEIINPSGKQTLSVSTELLGRKLTLEVNRVGFRSTSSVLVTYGDTVVLGSVVVGKKPVVQDFFPLSVDYEEKFYAAGKINGSKFIKREGKPADEAILVGRLIDLLDSTVVPEGVPAGSAGCDDSAFDGPELPVGCGGDVGGFDGFDAVGNAV